MSSEECRELLTVIVTSVLPEGLRILGTRVTQLPKTDDESKYPTGRKLSFKFKFTNFATFKLLTVY